MFEPITIPKGLYPLMRRHEPEPEHWEPTHAQIAARHLAFVVGEAPCYEMYVALDLVQRLARRDNERQRAFEAKRRAASEQTWTITCRPFSATVTVPADEIDPIEGGFRRVLPEPMTPLRVALLNMSEVGALATEGKSR